MANETIYLVAAVITILAGLNGAAVQLGILVNNVAQALTQVNSGLLIVIGIVLFFVTKKK